MKKLIFVLLTFAVFGCTKDEPSDDFLYFDEIKGQYNGHAVLSESGKSFMLPYQSITTKLIVKRNNFEPPFFEITEYDYSTVVRTFTVKPFATTGEKNNYIFKDSNMNDIASVDNQFIWVKKSNTGDKYYFKR
ncbi:hypothetical protein [Emticicia sp. W12TSBA100-4]|uniref:hypothetical protein n=1 Tax=Emticicia sp. W12TSBA100-4 TaxID=3160965 RepID=UPI0033055E39